MNRLDRVLDLRPLRHRDFRLLWIGTTAQMLGGRVAVVAVLVDVWELTRSPLSVGAIGLVTGVATAVFGLVGGTLADTVDRRGVILVTSAGAALAAALLATQSAAGAGSAVLVLAVVGLQTAFGSLGWSARRAFLTTVLPVGRVPAGVALGHLSAQAATLAGPALAGVVIARWGTGAAYGADALLIAVSLLGVARLPRSRPSAPVVVTADGRAVAGAGERRSMIAAHLTAGFRAATDGLRFVHRRPVLRGALASDLAATVLAMPVALFPVLNQERFGGDPRTLGLFLSAIAVGGLVAGVTSGPVTRSARPGRVGLVAAGVWGVALAGFGLVDGLVPTLVFLAVAGAADTISVISRGGLVQLATPDSYRGRVSSAEYVVGAGGPGIGDARAGAVAGLFSASTAAVTGGLACAVVVAGIAVVSPTLRRWRVPDRPS
ncbi:transmembrane secretion effector [Pseudonocardia sediminis]|uniref:Transmembrane secretion effector n=1 Tax=Pseudonocardia sediminis TaxID=1397368 RepID=A0A4Q7UVE9_PSEST|nr:MFS transporter [Pseudonocardia sediminis]RZT84053.1 transmembrane secretion effector [Pseudonocardia sediminis]